jgi:hypothetical protein
MEPEGSLPCSQEPSTGPYPEPDQSSPYHTILSLYIISLDNINRIRSVDWVRQSRLLPEDGDRIQSPKPCF